MARSSTEPKRRLILVELNEVNFDVARSYFDGLPLPAFKRLCAGMSVRTSSEQHYEELEPWIQWPSVHCGLTAAEHGVFRLGDITETSVPQIFEQLEQRGLKVGCISAMNAANRLSAPAYFIPDPWTRTPSDPSRWSRALSEAISQAVNDNAQSRISSRSAVSLLLGLIRFARPKHYGLYLKLALRSRKAPWRKALFLDLLLHDLHWRLFNRTQPDFSAVFFNAGAHIQHHYFFNAKTLAKQSLRNPEWYVAADEDPIAEMLEIYDAILSDYLAAENVEVIVATGLTQKPYGSVQFYYRLKNHEQFLGLLRISHREVLPRMTRDFLIEFESASQAADAQEKLGEVCIAGTNEPLFGGIDNRGGSLFVTLTYANEITGETFVEFEGRRVALAPHVAFVAIKNGMHDPTGFAFFTPQVAKHAPIEGAHVKALYSSITEYFERTA